mgnify:CR=1 FL=1
MSDRMINVLFICTGNSARSIMAEALLNDMAKGRFKAFSAGSHPAGDVSPMAIDLLKANGIDVTGLRSKNWAEFAAPDAPALDFVITVCDKAAGEVCPSWSGQPITVHWGVEDPLMVVGTEAQKRKAIGDVFRILNRRVSLFTCLPIHKVDTLSLKRDVAEIGRVVD